ncbi:MAG: signal peptide peptidase SppA [Myxococcales bacterium]|nr:signal peptide peptidase SppA [Myxococcales bacterium]
MLRRLSRQVAVVLFSMLTVASLVASTPIPPRLTAEVSDTFGLRTNPAGLGSLPHSELRLLYGFQPSEIDPAGDGSTADLHSGGLYGAWKLFDRLTLAGGYDFTERGSAAGAERGLVGVGLDFRIASLGFGWESRDAFGATGDFVRLGAQVRPIRWAALGLAVQDVGEAIGQRTWDLGLAVRPGLDWLTAAAQWSIVEDEALTEDTLQFRLFAEPLDGVLVGAYAADSFDILGLQLAIDFGRTGAEGALYVQDSNAVGVGTVAVRSERVESFFRSTKVIRVELQGDLRPPPRLSLLRQRVELGVYGRVPLELELIARAEDVVGAYVRIHDLDVGWATAKELRGAILRIRESKKTVLCAVSTPGDLEYYVASACSEVLIEPTTLIGLDGLAANLVFFGRALDWLGVEVAVAKRGAYKDAPNSFTEREPDASQVEVIQSLLDVGYRELVTSWPKDVASRRRRRGSDRRGHAHATMALARGFADAVLHLDEIEDYVRGKLGASVDVTTAAALEAPSRSQWGLPPQIALIPVDAVIVRGESQIAPLGFGATIGDETVRKALRRARKDPRVAAVVLRVDSPGGDAIASDRIAREVERCSRVKPVIASFGDIATSGGYYVAAPATRIFAEPTTVTGSIGVFSVRASVYELLDKLGVDVFGFERGRHADLGSIVQPLDEGAQAITERQVDFLYQRFLEVVAEGRGLDVTAVRDVAEGRVWAGVRRSSEGSSTSSVDCGQRSTTPVRGRDR